jgi:hypothetical protein
MVLVAMLAAGCAPVEQSVVDRFFGASRLRDKTALGSVSTVIFEPLEHGIVTRFEIVRVVPATEMSKMVVVEAPVKRPDGRVVQETIRLTLELRQGRWLVTAFAM